MADRIAKAQHQENSAHEQQQQANARNAAINEYSGVVEYYRMKYNAGPNDDSGNCNEIALNSKIPDMIAEFSNWLKNINDKSTDEIISHCKEMKDMFKKEMDTYHKRRMEELEIQKKREEEEERKRREEEERKRREDEERRREELKQKVMRWQQLDEDSRNLICFLSVQDYEFLEREKETV